MSSKRTAANQANARRSTGPRTNDGKMRSRSNALRHGLAVPVAAIPELAHHVAQLALAIAGNDTDDPHIFEAAVRVAEAAVDVLRTCRARVELLSLSPAVPRPATPSPASTTQSKSESECETFESVAAQLAKLDRYDRRSRSRRDRAIRALEEARATALSKNDSARD